MNREESLGKRLLNYLGLKYRFREYFSFSTHRVIDIFPPRMKSNDFPDYYNSWHDLLFGHPGRYGLRDLRKWLCYRDSPWFECKSKAFRFENLDELEMQLSVRGF